MNVVKRRLDEVVWDLGTTQVILAIDTDQGATDIGDPVDMTLHYYSNRFFQQRQKNWKDEL